jgi:polyhydroxyalkanoate synthesis regulator phasin
MSEERKLILQMVAEGKVTPDEGEMLLQAMEESERAGQVAAPAQMPHAEARPVNAQGLGERIEQVATESFRGLDRALSGLEAKLHRKLDEQRTTAADRTAQPGRVPAQRSRMIKMGISIDRESVQQQEELTIPTRSGDRLVLDNRIGDVTVRFTDDPEIAVEVRKTVWGADRADAEERATLTRVAAMRRGADLVLEVSHPSISAVGVMVLKDTRLDYSIRAPHGTNLQVRNKVGDLRVVAGDQVGIWDLETKVGDVDLKVGPGAMFRHDLDARVGKVQANLAETQPGQVGDGAGNIRVAVKTGDIRLQQ